MQQHQQEQKNKLNSKIEKVLEYETNIMKSNNHDNLFSERKSNFINAPFEIDDNHFAYINTITEGLTMLPYFLYFSSSMQNNAQLIVDTLNSNNKSSTYNRVELSKYIANELAKYTTLSINSPMLYIFIPHVSYESEPYYQQLSRECFQINKNEKYNRIDLMIKKSIQDAQSKLRNFTSKEISDKITLNGYSTSGVLAQRFALIHPEIVDKAIIGGAAGSIPIPTTDIEYPIGIKDFYQLFNKDFNEKAYKLIDFAYYVGEFETYDCTYRSNENGRQILVPTHDMSFMEKSVPLNIGIKQRDLLGYNLQDRFQNSINWYKDNNYKIQSKIYRMAKHQSFNKNYIYLKNFLQDILNFYKSGCNGDGFKKDISGVESLSITEHYEHEL